MQRESMEFDVVIVGAGPAGLSAAIALKKANKDLSVVVLEKGSEVGAHILSGAIFETTALDELIPDWKKLGAPVKTAVKGDDFYLYKNEEKATKLPHFFIPKSMHNDGNYIISLGNLCRWMAEQAEEMGVEIFPGFSAADILYNDEGAVRGVVTNDMGIDYDGNKKDSFEPGMELLAKYTLFSEGCRGHLGKQLIERYQLSDNCDAQHYALGVKEIWEIDPKKHQEGLVVHGAGWPLSENSAAGGSFSYHAENNQLVIGLITDLNYRNPYLSPFEEFQRFKMQKMNKTLLEGGKRISYGARAITKGGMNALPRQHFPGGLLIGCDAGTLNFSKIKGSHTAMKSGMLAAQVVAEAITSGNNGGSDLMEYTTAFKQSWLYDELQNSRNFGAALHNYGMWVGGAINFIQYNLFGGKFPITLRDNKPDNTQLVSSSHAQPIEYPKPDGVITFDRLSSVYLSNTNHEEAQPCHLTLKNSLIPIEKNLAIYDAPEQRYCPAGVYEIITKDDQPQLQINAQNCIHCKTCDIKDPTQNIHWITPEGGGGPNYTSM